MWVGAQGSGGMETCKKGGHEPTTVTYESAAQEPSQASAKALTHTRPYVQTRPLSRH